MLIFHLITVFIEPADIAYTMITAFLTMKIFIVTQNWVGCPDIDQLFDELFKFRGCLIACPVNPTGFIVLAIYLIKGSDG